MNHIGSETPRWACRVCKLTLMEFPGPDATTTFVHARPWETQDHEPDPVPGASVNDRPEVCDFCGAIGATWRYHGEKTSAYGQHVNGGPLEEVQSVDGLWFGCDACDVYVRRNDIDGISARYRASPTVQRADEYLRETRQTERAPSGTALIEHQRQLWAAYLPTIRHRDRIPVRPPLPPMRPAQMPRIRDRLADFWLTPMARAGIRSDAQDSGYVTLPRYLVEEHTQEAICKIPYEAVTTEVIDRHVNRVTEDLLFSELYWVSPQFTHLAVTAAKTLPDVTLTPQELPANQGLLIWETAVHEVVVKNWKAAIFAVSWSVIPGGLWVSAYCKPESGPSKIEPEVLRREIGWLLPFSIGGGASFGTHQIPEAEGNHIIRAMIATWLLMKQPGMAERTDEPVHADIRKKYKKAGRPSPAVHVVNIRKTERAARPAGTQTGRNYTGSWAVGLRTGGFWRTYWTGSGRSVRDRRWIDPYLARADLPMKGDAALKPTVKVLR